MGKIGAFFRRQSGQNAGAIDLFVQLGQGIPWLDASPDRVHPAFSFELPQAGERDGKWGKVDQVQRVGHILRLMRADLPDEAQRQVQLHVILPSCASYVAGQGQQSRADFGGRTDGDEQPVHADYIE